MTKGASVSFPTGQGLGKPTGVESPELPPREQDQLAEKHSRSPRPDKQTIFARTALQPPVVSSSAIGGSKGLVRSWEGLNGFQQRYANGGNQFSLEPPDQALCVGNGKVLEATNDVLRVFSGTGSAVSDVTDLNTFYGYPAAINRTTGRFGPFVTDPTCIFDQGTRKFYLVVLTLDVDPASGAFLGPNHLDLAVSRTSDPTKRWDIYRLPAQDDGTQGTPKHKDCPCIGDYPHIGSDANAIFLTSNEYPFSDDPGVFGNNFNGAQIYAVDKHALARSARTARVVQFQETSIGRGDSRVPGFTLWPAQVPDGQYAKADRGTEYFLSSVAAEEAQPRNFTGMANRIGLYAVTNTASLATRSPNLRLSAALVSSQTYGVPPRSSQKVGPVPLRDCLAVNCVDLGVGNVPMPNEAEGPLDSNDSRMQQVYYSGGTLYGALDTVLRVENNLQAGIAWFAVDPGARPSSANVSRQGYVGVAHQNVNYPALAVLPDGTGVMAMTLVGRNHYPTAAYLNFGASGTGTVQIAANGRAPQDGFSEYNAFANPGSPARPRWGDYGAAVTSGSSVYIASEYIAHSCSFTHFEMDLTCGETRAPLINWSTRISQVTP